jgi:PhzF family phenazine biosynthesis protein
MDIQARPQALEINMRYYVVDAFADKIFEGNPAGICVMETWLPDELMQNIAMENNLSETAFAVKEGEGYRLRWFTPGGEIDLCGHATLATAYIIMRFSEPGLAKVSFDTLSGKLDVAKKDDLYELNFPAYSLQPVPVTALMEEVIGAKPLEAWMARDLVCVLDAEDKIFNAAPNLQKSLELDGLLLHLTARGSKFDCVSRSFAPKVGVDEDPVCGSGHCHIAPLWSKKLGKAALVARQASKRGGTLYCTVEDERIKLSGRAALYSIAELHI